MMVYHKFQSLIGNVQHIITANNNTHFVFQSLIGNMQHISKITSHFTFKFQSLIGNVQLIMNTESTLAEQKVSIPYR